MFQLNSPKPFCTLYNLEISDLPSYMLTGQDKIPDRPSNLNLGCKAHKCRAVKHFKGTLNMASRYFELN